MSTRLDSTYLLALFPGAWVWVISSVGDVFMAVGTVFIWAGFKAVYLGPASAVYSRPSQIIVRFMSWIKHQFSVYLKSFGTAKSSASLQITMKWFCLAQNEQKIPVHFPWMLSDCEELQGWMTLTCAEQLPCCIFTHVQYHALFKHNENDPHYFFLICNSHIPDPVSCGIIAV